MPTTSWRLWDSFDCASYCITSGQTEARCRLSHWQIPCRLSASANGLTNPNPSRSLCNDLIAPHVNTTPSSFIASACRWSRSCACWCAWPRVWRLGYLAGPVPYLAQSAWSVVSPLRSSLRRHACRSGACARQSFLPHRVKHALCNVDPEYVHCLLYGTRLCCYMGSLILKSFWLIAIDPHRGGAISQK